MPEYTDHILDATFEANEIWVYFSKGNYASTLISLMLFIKELKLAWLKLMK